MAHARRSVAVSAPEPKGERAIAAAPAPPAEVVLHELGESLATTVVAVQAELARYPNGLGAYLLDEIEVAVPLAMRLDDLGQTVIRVVEGEAAGAAQVRFKIRPVLGATEPPPVAATQPLSALGVLSRDEIARLHARRVFSVDDLQRVARNAAGRAALSKLSRQLELDRVLGRSAVLSLPCLPAPVAQELVRTGTETPAAFVTADPEGTAAMLTAQLAQTITAGDVKRWQDQVRPLVTLKLPTRGPFVDGDGPAPVG